MTRKILSSLFCFLLVSFGIGGNIYVTTNGPSTDPYDTWAKAATNIEWAVNVGTNGDTVWISNGTYYLTNQITVNSNIMVCGTGGVVVVNGNNANRCFYFTNTVNKGGGLSNLFITGGYTNDHGGGAWIRYGTVQDCIFSNNVCATNGGGMYFSGTGLVKNCTFVDNKAYYNGGGLCVTSGQSVAHCEFHTNTAGYNGGGIYFDRSTITGCVFTCNVATNNGGGAYFFYTGTIKNSTIVSNIAGSLGGGICEGNGSSSGWILDCFISNNIAATAGGGIDAYATTINNCVIARNQCLFTGGTYSWYGGGGVALTSSGNTIYNSIIEENITAKYGGGIHFLGGIARNCLIKNNTATNGGGGVMMGKASAAYNSSIYNCTIVSNSVPDGRGGRNI